MHRLWYSRPEADQALVWGIQRGRTDVPGHWERGRGWQRLPGGKGQALPVLLTCWKEPGLRWEARGSRCCLLVPAGAGVGDGARMPEESSPQRQRACAKSMADEGKEVAAWPSRAVTLVHDANCSWQEWSHLMARASAWLGTKLYRTACSRHGEAARPIRPYGMAACKHRHLKWQLRLEMDCTCFPCTHKCTVLKKKLPIKKIKIHFKKMIVGIPLVRTK